MSAMLRIVARVIQRRLESGEPWEQVIQDYPRLSQGEILLIQQSLNG